MIIKRGREIQTAFGRIENPLSEGGRFINGLTNGIGWCDMQSSGGYAYGTQTVHAHPPYDDSACIWIPPDNQQWADMEIEAQVRIGDRSGWNNFHELELHLRMVGSGNLWRGYEVLFSANAGSTYTEIARWEGPAGGTYSSSGTGTSVTSLTGGAVFNLTINDGDWIKASIVGNTITQWHRPASSTDGLYVQKNQVTDTTWKAGYPGFGHWLNGAGNNSDYGLSYWRARQLS